MIRFVRTVTIARRTAGTVDNYGNQALATTATTATTGELQLLSSNEDQRDRDTVVSDWMLMVPAGTGLARYDLATVDDQTFEVVGEPETVVSPWTGAASHIEARVRLTVG